MNMFVICLLHLILISWLQIEIFRKYQPQPLTDLLCTDCTRHKCLLYCWYSISNHLSVPCCVILITISTKVCHPGRHAEVKLGHLLDHVQRIANANFALIVVHSKMTWFVAIGNSTNFSYFQTEKSLSWCKVHLYLEECLHGQRNVGL